MSDYDATDDFAKSLEVGYASIRARMAAGAWDVLKHNVKVAA